MRPHPAHTARFIALAGTGVLTAALAAGTDASAQTTTDLHAAHDKAGVHFPVSCSARAQAQFDTAITQLHHMTYPEARAGFERVAVTDPQCAMAHWGIAMTLFQPLWPSRPNAQALQRGWDEVQQARSLAPPTPREQLFVAAAEAFFLEPTGTDYWQRIARWEAAAARAHRQLPEDSELAVFHALAQLATAPSKTVSREHADRAAAVLLEVRERDPDHPGVMHYLIHANDIPGRESEQLQVTRHYETTAPDNAHALHMPTHIYTRLGDWNGVVRGNLRSAAAALRQPANQPGRVSDEYAHAVEYLVYGYLQQGDDANAQAQLRKLHDTANLETGFKAAFHLASTQARYALERHDWAQAAAIVPRQSTLVDWDKFAWPESISQFARGLGAARGGQIEQAQAASTRMQELETAVRSAGEDLFARSIEVLRVGLGAWIAQAQGRRDAAVTAMRQAAALEAATPKHPVTPGPTLPAEELLGDLLMEQGNAAAALAAYQASLSRYPNRFNSLLGAARAADAVQDPAAAARYYRTLLETAPDSRRPALEDARRSVGTAKR